MLPGPAVPGCCLVSFCFLCDIHSVHIRQKDINLNSPKHNSNNFGPVHKVSGCITITQRMLSARPPTTGVPSSLLTFFLVSIDRSAADIVIPSAHSLTDHNSAFLITYTYTISYCEIPDNWYLRNGFLCNTWYWNLHNGLLWNSFIESDLHNVWRTKWKIWQGSCVKLILGRLMQPVDCTNAIYGYSINHARAPVEWGLVSSRKSLFAIVAICCPSKRARLEQFGH